jgi:hypothetical protein
VSEPQVLRAPRSDDDKEIVFWLREVCSELKKTRKAIEEEVGALTIAIEGDDQGPGLMEAMASLSPRVEALVQIFAQIKKAEGGGALLAHLLQGFAGGK